ncbi:HEAT repeat domain-containing protein [Gimesia aquarii]|uniref:HEAT repeat protein n=1 Tax=Gimesia aquarii TaxID=2527964 RepID=A0A517WT08_9PLAN|nr:HEAT repeat domain-containing protein [Gimesia aquarii]QDU08392.1 hypothetical protein V202x_17600 [Gimesia aquarii]
MEAVNLSGDPDLSMLDQIPWTELSHAYGAAIDVPEQIRALVTADKDERGGLLWGFTSNLFHQGSVYSATVAAIPLFQQLLRYQSITEKPLILELLANFALGYPEDLDYVKLNEFVGHSKREYSHANDEYGRECYLGVAAGMPLYEALLDDENPRTIISSCYLMAFFPAHAFDRCPRLLTISTDESQPDTVRCSALIACSYLNGGSVAEQYFDLLSDLLKNGSVELNTPVPLLIATAAYCALRKYERPKDESQRALAMQVAEQALQNDILLSDDGVYPKPAQFDADDLVGYSQQLYHPDEAFPWGDLLLRLEKVSRKKSAALKARRQREMSLRKRKRLDPSIYNVQPNAFDRDNVLAAVRRLHAWLDVKRDKLPQDVLDEFEPFKPYLDLVWDEVLKLLDSDDRFVSTAAQSLVQHATPLSDMIINSLIDRLHNGDTGLANVLKECSLSEQQCGDMCDRLVSGRFESGFGKNQETYREIVCKQGTDEQLWKLFNHIPSADRTWARLALIGRGLLDEHDPRVYDIQATDCMSNNLGPSIGARFNFAKSNNYQEWFFSNYQDLEKERRWAVIEAMEQFGADLTLQEEVLRTTMASEEYPLLKAKLIRLMNGFHPVTREHLQYLLSLLNADASAVERSAIVTTLGNWLSRGLDDRLIPELLKLTSDESVSVRRIALSVVAFGNGPDTRHGDDKVAIEIGGATDVLRGALSDGDEQIRRLAIYHLFRRKALSPDDLTLVMSKEESDRVLSEALLAAALLPQTERFGLEEKSRDLPKKYTLTSSVLNWVNHRS